MSPVSFRWRSPLYHRENSLISFARYDIVHRAVDPGFPLVPSVGEVVNSLKVAPPNSLVLIWGSSDPSIPSSMTGTITATDSCIVVGCRYEADGETEITLGAAQEVDPGGRPAFDGRLLTPDRHIEVRSVLGEVLLTLQVDKEETILRIWLNDLKEPDRVILGIE